MIRKSHRHALPGIRWHSRSAALALGALLLAMAGSAGLAWTQQNDTPALDPGVQAPAIISHLNAVLQFYRSVSLPIQKVGEPSDIVYRDQAVNAAAQVTGFAFQSAQAEAAFMQSADKTQPPSSPAAGPQPNLQATLAATEKRIIDLRNRQELLTRQLAVASPRSAAVLLRQRDQVQAALELSLAMQDALQRITKISAETASRGLSADIDRLQHSVPEVQTAGKSSAPLLGTVQSALSDGVTSQAGVLIRLLESLRDITTLLHANDNLQQRAIRLRAPMLTILRSLIRQGQQLSRQTDQSLPPSPAQAHPPATPAAPTAPSAPDLRAITARFKSLSAATVPLSQEIIVLQQSHANLVAWQSSVDNEYDILFRALLLRLLVILIALALIIGGGNLWTRATNRYIRDLRRRRQILVVRRVVVVFLCCIVLVFGFITRFNSLATFAGFITAGIAVGLQTILLSVAAYFFIIGRFGIKVGDRITIASVTGDVIEVGLLRFYLMELAGTGNALNSTGRVAVFSNAVLFQATTPLYKQLPGTEFAWHELIVRLTAAADYRTVCDAIMREVHAVYDEYRAAIEHQHESIRNWMHATIPPPQVESRLHFGGGDFQLWARFPVQIRHAAETDEKITQRLLHLIDSDPAVKAAVAATPTIQPAVRG